MKLMRINSFRIIIEIYKLNQNNKKKNKLNNIYQNKKKLMTVIQSRI